MLDRMQAETMTVKQLRDYARANNGHGMTGKEIIFCNKAELITKLTLEPTSNLFPKTNQRHEVAQGSTDPLADILAKALEGKISAGVDESAVSAIATAIIDNRLENFRPAIRTIEIKDVKTGAIKDMGLQHEAFEDILKLSQLRANIMLVGPAGSGKTTACSNVAKALDLPFESTSVCMQTTKSDLLGYIDAHSNYVSTRLREMYENGGVFLLDEIDSGNPNVLTVINSLAENGHGPFPDQTIQRHDDFVLIAAANTWGLGGNIEYVGRNPIDAATRDRFAMIAFGYDERLERALANNDSWVDRVQMLRRAINGLREKNVMATPRASIKGAQFLANGFNQDEVENMLIFKGVNPEVKSRVLAQAGA